MSENEEKVFPKKRVYKKRSPAKKITPPPYSGKGLSPEDLEAFKGLAPKLSPKGQEVLNLLLRVFNEDGELNSGELLHLINSYLGQAQNPALSQLMNLLPLLSGINQSGNQQMNPALITSLLSMLMSNRPK